jgi:hypothetical protein
VMEFSIACVSASITPFVSKWWPFGYLHLGKQKSHKGPSQVGRVGEGRQLCCFLVKRSLVKKKVWDSALSWYNSQFFCH